MRIHAAAAFLLIAMAHPAAQTPADRERAKIQMRLGDESMRAERWEEAARSYQNAIDIDPKFERAYYGLGRADMALKKFADAIRAYTKCRDLYQAQAGRQFANQQDAQRFRNDRLMEYDEMLRQLRSGPQTQQTQDQIRLVENAKREIQNVIQRDNTFSIDVTIPAWVSLALGSAYFRSERFADAEREYKAALAVDQNAGEAHNNLAVLYLETGRIDEADKSIAAAKKVGFRVHPQLEQEIKRRKPGS